MQRLLLIGLNHTTAPLDVREKLAFGPSRLEQAITQLRQQFDACEAVILSTCNRVELYLCAAEPIDRDRVIAFLKSFHSLPDERFTSHLYEMRGRSVIEHLFAVTSSLDSMVLGETQILGQVRSAYEAARDIGAAGPLMHPLFQRAVGVGKEVLSQTQIGQGRVSVASVAVDYASRIFDTFADKTVLCMGTGKMSQLVLRQFVGLKPKHLIVASRRLERAHEVAQQFGGEAVSSVDLDPLLVQADIVVSSTGHPEPLITRKRFEPLLRPRRYRPVFMIDIAVPRDIDPSVGDLEGVYLYNLDDLQEVVTRTIDSRGSAVETARAIINRHVDTFLAWHRQREIGPVIDALYKRSNQIARAELERTCGKLQPDAQQQAHLEELVHRIVQKMLHDPVSQLRAPDPHESGQAYVHAIEKLFKLEPPREPDDQ
jgi:glutamyl-tRNA reductase